MARKQPFGNWIDWVDGQPVPRYSEPMSQKTAFDLIPSALALPYVPKRYTSGKKKGRILPEEKPFVGMTFGQVMVLRAVMNATSNDASVADQIYAATFLMDRTIGKPKQRTEVIATSLTYSELLQGYKEQDINEEDVLLIEASKQNEWAEIEVINAKDDDENNDEDFTIGL